MYSVHCTLYNVQSTLCKLYSAYIPYSAQCPVCSLSGVGVCGGLPVPCLDPAELLEVLDTGGHQQLAVRPARAVTLGGEVSYGRQKCLLLVYCAVIVGFETKSLATADI